MAHTLLLADDSVTIQRVIELTFADEDVRVVAVGDGDQAIAAIESRPPDIVLADIGMPGKNGYEVAQHIQSSPRLSHIPVLLLTGAFEPVDQERARQVGCDGVLAKPFEPQLVIGRVKELLSRPKQRVQSTGAPAAPPPFDEPAIARAPLLPGQPQVDEYFDRLDAAFANLSQPVPEPGSGPKPTPDQIDWFASAPPATGADLPLSYTPPAQPFPLPASIAPVAAPAPPPSFPPLADAFAALLAAEQAGPGPSSVPVWPAHPPAAASPAVTDEIVAAVTRRVLDSLSDRVVRETVAEIVSSVAERLVKEEIERVKNSIK